MKRDSIKVPNRAAALYARIGGTAFNQSMAIELGWKPDRKTTGPARPAGTKLLRSIKEGVCTVRHGGPFDLRGNAVRTKTSA